jgi:hypothetical protein
MLSVSEVAALGVSVDNVFRGNGDGSRSVTCQLQGESLILKFQTIVHFAGEHSLRSQVGTIAQESVDILSAKVKSMKEAFKEATGSALKLEEISNDDNVEVIQATAGSLRKVAYYRRHAVMVVKN